MRYPGDVGPSTRNSVTYDYDFGFGCEEDRDGAERGWAGISAASS